MRRRIRHAAAAMPRAPQRDAAALAAIRPQISVDRAYPSPGTLRSSKEAGTDLSGKEYGHDRYAGGARGSHGHGPSIDLPRGCGGPEGIARRAGVAVQH